MVMDLRRNFAEKLLRSLLVPYRAQLKNLPYFYANKKAVRGYGLYQFVKG